MSRKRARALPILLLCPTSLVCPYLFRFAARSTISSVASRMTQTCSVSQTERCTETRRRRKVANRRAVGKWKREVIGEEEGEEKKKKKKLIFDKRELWDDVEFSALRRGSRDSARLPKLRLDLNRSRLEKYLPPCRESSRSISTISGYLSRVRLEYFFLSHLSLSSHRNLSGFSQIQHTDSQIRFSLNRLDTPNTS